MNDIEHKQIEDIYQGMIFRRIDESTQSSTQIDIKTQKSINQFINKLVAGYEQATSAQQQQIQQTLEDIVNAKEDFNKIQQIISNVTKQQPVTEGFARNIKAGYNAAKSGINAVKQNIKNVGKDDSLSMGQAVKQGYNQSIKGDLNKEIDAFKTNVGRHIAELQRDFKEMRFDAAKYPEIENAINAVTAELSKSGIVPVDTKWDRFTHGVGRFAGGAVTNAAIFSTLAFTMGATGVNPYVAKAISGAAASVLRDIKNGKTADRGMAKRALLGAGIGVAIQGAMAGGSHLLADRAASKAAEAASTAQHNGDFLSSSYNSIAPSESATGINLFPELSHSSATTASNIVNNVKELTKISGDSQNKDKIIAALIKSLGNAHEKELTAIDTKIERLLSTATNMPQQTTDTLIKQIPRWTSGKSLDLGLGITSKLGTYLDQHQNEAGTKFFDIIMTKLNNAKTIENLVDLSNKLDKALH